MGRPPSFEDCLKPGQPLRAEVDREPIAKQIVDVAQGLEGIVRNSSIHAAAVVIADRPLTDIVPLQIADAGTDESGEKVFRTVTQFTMKPVEQIGLLKMDFLGLRNLDVIEDALDIIERSTGERPDMATLPLDDAEDLRDDGPRRLDRRVPVRVRGDAGDAQAGQADRVRAPDRAQRAVPARADGADPRRTRAAKHNPESVTYPDERLRPILESTNGVIVYQEQAMQIAKEIAGFSGAKADDLRKAIGKKNREAMAKLKPEFFDGCRASGTSEPVIEQLWTTNERSADYSFNKSHAACYALIAYRTAWLKANYPAEYMAALISSVMDTKDKVPFFVAQAEQMGISILPPDVNLSDHEFVVVDGNIRFGLDAVKGVGYAAVEAIKTRARGGRPVPRPVRLLRPRRQPRGQQEGDRGADQVRRVRLDRRRAQGHADGARAGAGRRAEGPAGRADRPGLDLRPRIRRRRAAAAPAGARARATPRSRRASSTAPSCWPPRRSRSGCSSRLTR